MTFACKKAWFSALVVGLLQACATAQTVASSGGAMPVANQKAVAAGDEAWVKKHMVVVRSYTQRPEFARPWRRQKPYSRVSNALVISGNRLLLTTNDAQTMSLIEVRRVGEQEWYRAKLLHVEHDLPAAVLSVEDNSFFAPLEATPLDGEAPPRESDVDLVDAVNDNPEFGKGRITAVENWRVERLAVPSLVGTTSMTDFGDSEVVLFNGRVVGLSQASRKGGFVAMLSSVLKNYVSQTSQQPYRGYGRAGIRVQDLTNPALKRMLGLTKEDGGIRVVEVDPGDSADGALQTGDVLLAVEGIAIDSKGQINHPRWGRIYFSATLMDNRNAGDTVTFSVFRNAQRQNVKLPLKRVPVGAELIPSHMLSEEPRYAVHGGLVFQALNQVYLASHWASAPAPVLNASRIANRKTSAMQDVVVLTEVLPDSINLGYQDLRNLVVERVNGKPIAKLEDVALALKSPQGAYHVFEFQLNERRIVLDASQLDSANQRIPLN